MPLCSLVRSSLVARFSCFPFMCSKNTRVFLEHVERKQADLCIRRLLIMPRRSNMYYIISSITAQSIITWQSEDQLEGNTIFVLPGAVRMRRSQVWGYRWRDFWSFSGCLWPSHWPDILVRFVFIIPPAYEACRKVYNFRLSVRLPVCLLTFAFNR